MVYNLLACGYPYLANTWANILDVYSVLHYMLLSLHFVAMAMVLYYLQSLKVGLLPAILILIQ